MTDNLPIDEQKILDITQEVLTYLAITRKSHNMNPYEAVAVCWASFCASAGILRLRPGPKLSEEEIRALTDKCCTIAEDAVRDRLREMTTKAVEEAMKAPA